MKFSAQGLAKAGMDLIPPFQVRLRLDPQETSADLVTLNVKDIARVLGGRRFSGRGELNGRDVFAKVFYGEGARRYWQRELTGARRMAKARVPTPELLAHGCTDEGDGFVVIYEALDNPLNMVEPTAQQLDEAMLAFAKLHGAQFIQSDPHLANFVVSADRVYLVDADGVRRTHLIRHQFKNLALFLAQRPPWLDGEIPRLWRIYAEARGDYVTEMGSAEAMAELTLAERRHRVDRYLEKTQRECSDFVHRRSFRRDFLCVREDWSRLQRFMVFPERYVGEGTPLKLGNSATVVRIEVDGVSYVVKRYNLKSFGHRVRRWFKRRARNAWQNGHLLDFLGIQTARPVALLEQRWGWFVGVCYLVMPDVGDRDLGQVLRTDPGQFASVSQEVTELLSRLKHAGLRHGDLKATNFIQHRGEDGVVGPMTLIDFDAVTFADGASDRRRFMENWDEEPELAELWASALEAANV